MRREVIRKMRSFANLETLLQDVRYAARSLRKYPVFLAVVVFSLALGIGANTTIFSVLNAVLYRPMPYEHPQQLVTIWQTDEAHANSEMPPPIAEMSDWKMQNHVFEDIALTSFTESATLSGIGEPEPIRVQNATPNFFHLLGVKPILGRMFLAEEMHDKSQAVLISSSFWKTHFNNDPNVLGRAFNIEGVVSTVVGVMPAGFAPFYGGKIDLWQPINAESSRYSARNDHWLMPVARLKPGVTLAQAQVEMDVIARRLEQAFPATNKGVGKKVVTLHKALFGWAGEALYPLLGAVAFVLLIGCVNVANLLQSRTEGRRKEFALRASLGAGRRRLTQQLLVESGLLALLGGFLGAILAIWGIGIFRKLAVDFPNAEKITLDGRVLLFTLGVSVLSAILIGLAPAIQASRPDLNLALRESERGTGAASRNFARYSLVVSEVALTMVLLVGAGLMINTLLRLRHVNPGFDPKNVMTMEIQLPEGGKYLERVPGGDMEKTLPSVTAFYEQLLEKIKGIPGLESAGLMSSLPLHGAERFTFSILGHPAPPLDNRPRAGFDEVSPDVFSALRIPLRKGRYLNAHDSQSAPWALVVNESFARRYFPNEDPIGQQLLLRYDAYQTDEPRPRQIVGIVGDVKHFGLGEDAPPFVYASYLQQPAIFPGGAALAHLHQGVVLRLATGFSGTQADLASALKKAVAELDPEQPVTNVMTMQRVVAESMTDWEFYARLLEIFAGIAVLLAVVGIYGVMSSFVSGRTREIGIRMALGAQRTNVLGQIAKLGLKLTTIGVVVGSGLAVVLTRLIARFLYGVTPTDPGTYTEVTMALVGVALLACFIPARRATKVDPMVALRHE
jgi:putative ABC transport system permease protein